MLPPAPPVSHSIIALLLRCQARLKIQLISLANLNTRFALRAETQASLMSAEYFITRNQFRNFNLKL